MGKSVFTHVVVDMLYDFIDGSLACANAAAAVEGAVSYIRKHPAQRVLYVADHHPAGHCSFIGNGGIWPDHCVAGTRGGEIHHAFDSLPCAEARPDTARNVFYKGCDASEEEYSGFNARSSRGERICEALGRKVIISGIATEYCIRETCMALLESGREVHVNVPGLAFITPEGHLATLAELEKAGARMVGR